MKFQSSERETDNLPRVKLADRESVQGVLRGDPYEYRTHWVGDHSELCSGGNTCQRCDGEKPKYRFRLNMIVYENGAFVAKVVEQGWKLKQQIESLTSVYTLEETIVKISREGKGKNDTTYTVIPIPKPLTPEQLIAINEIPLHNLRTHTQSNELTVEQLTARAKVMVPANASDDVPF